MVDNIPPEELEIELSGRQIEQLDAIEGTLLDLGQRVHRPAIITEKDGTVHLEEYQEPVLQTPKKNKKKEKPAYER